MTSPFPNSYWLEPGRIICGEYPRDFDDLGDHEGMTAILKAGARVFIDLTEEGELKPYGEIVAQAAGDLAIAPEEFEYHRFPIPDVSIPGSRETVEQILRVIRSARHRHEVVYLHCWGGRGRTGTIAGCALSELFGLDGDAALEQLQRRWKDCAKSSRGDSPETGEQTGFVRRFNPVGWDRRGEKIRSAILGAAVGDALGVPVEFQSRESRQEAPVTGMRGFGAHHQPAGTWSDDTSMILATMTALTEAGRYDPAAVMKEFALWMTEAKHTPHGKVFGMGNATRSAIGKYLGGTEPARCGGRDEWSNGNGSLMRILPIGLAYADDPDLIEKAWDISSLTHAHERSLFCCAFYCLVVSDLLHGGTLREATAFAWEVMDRRWSFSPEERTRFESLHPDRLFQRPEDHVGSSGHVIDTLEASLWVNARHGDYAGAVLHAVNLGEDTDTTGCVAGGLAGLLYGEEGIPGEWLEVLARLGEMEEQAASFAEFGRKTARKGLS